MAKLQIREALRRAMVEEMRRDDTVFLMGEEVAYYDGAYKVSQGMLAEFGEKRIIDTPIAENGFCGVGIGVLGERRVQQHKGGHRHHGSSTGTELGRAPPRPSGTTERVTRRSGDSHSWVTRAKSAAVTAS